MMKYLIYLLAAGLYVMAGCTNPKSINEANLKAAIDEHLEQEGIGCVRVGNRMNGKNHFPHEVKSSIFSHEPKMIKLSSMGFLTSRIKRNYGYRNSRVYDLTEKGRAYFNEDENAFCYGKVRVKEIVHYTKPYLNSHANSPYTGYTTSMVNYTLKVENLADWAKTEEAQDAFPFLRTIVENKKPVEDSEVLILTNNGWVHNGVLFEE